MDNRVWVVAAWEFKRYFKWKGELFSLALIIALALASFGGNELIARLMSDDPVRIAVITDGDVDPDGELFAVPAGDLLLFERRSTGDEAQLLSEIADESLQGILYLSEAGSRVLVYEEDSWLDLLRDFLGQVRQHDRMLARAITSEDLLDIMAPAQLTVDYHPQGNPPSSQGERLFAMVVLGLMLIGIFTSFGYFFISITSEKQQRITEQIISAVSPQTWIDGKLIGIYCMSLKSMLTAGLTAGLGILLYSQLSDQPWLIAGFGGDPVTLISMVLFGLGGLMFWSCFLAAIAATVSDPNTSTRTPLMLLPSIPMVIGFAGLSQPDSLGMQLLSWIPVTSMGVMPMRLALGDVAMWEIALSLVLLAFGIAWLRRAASRIFEVSMLIYGKEPSFAEMRRWFKEVG